MGVGVYFPKETRIGSYEFIRENIEWCLLDLPTNDDGDEPEDDGEMADWMVTTLQDELGVCGRQASIPGERLGVQYMCEAFSNGLHTTWLRCWYGSWSLVVLPADSDYPSKGLYDCGALLMLNKAVEASEGVGWVPMVRTSGWTTSPREASATA